MLKLLLRGCTAIFEFLLGLYFLGFAFNIVAFFRGEQTNWSSINPISHYKQALKTSLLLPNLVVLIALAGLTNTICSGVLASTQIGAFYEKDSYSECYDATLYIDEKPIFCLVEMSRESEIYDDKKHNWYSIHEIHLPYGKSQDIDDGEYDPVSNSNSYYIGDSYYRHKIVLHSPATVHSYERLKYEVISSYGEFCGSRTSNTFHLLDCHYVKTISPEHLVYFDSWEEIYILGYTMCERCYQNY